MNVDPEIELSFEPQTEFLIRDVETLKVLSDELRLTLLEYLVKAPHTAKEMAAFLNLVPNKLYYHLNMLEEKGLVRVVRTRVVSGIIEKTYRATAHTARIDRHLFEAHGAAEGDVGALLSAVFDAARNDFQAAHRAGLLAPLDETQSSHKVGRATGRLTSAQFRALYTQVAALMDTFNQEPPENETTTDYELFFALFPIPPLPPNPPEPPTPVKPLSA